MGHTTFYQRIFHIRLRFIRINIRTCMIIAHISIIFLNLEDDIKFGRCSDGDYTVSREIKEGAHGNGDTNVYS